MITKYKSFWNNSRNLNEELIDFTEASASYIDEIKSYFPTREEFQFLYRGFEIPSDKTYIYKRQTNRLPLSTSEEYHNLFDEIFRQIFRWHVRSDGTFAIANEYTAKRYGELMLFFPIGDYRYVFSETVSDLFSRCEYLTDETYYAIEKTLKSDEDVMQFVNENPDIWDDAQYSIVEDFIKKHYQDEDLMLGLDKGVEIVFDCDEYYLFPFSMKDTILDIIYA